MYAFTVRSTSPPPPLKPLTPTSPLNALLGMAGCGVRFPTSWGALKCKFTWERSWHECHATNMSQASGTQCLGCLHKLLQLGLPPRDVSALAEAALYGNSTSIAFLLLNAAYVFEPGRDSGAPDLVATLETPQYKDGCAALHYASNFGGGAGCAPQRHPCWCKDSRWIEGRVDQTL
jgi:hypothetical protein